MRAWSAGGPRGRGRVPSGLGAHAVRPRVRRSRCGVRSGFSPVGGRPAYGAGSPRPRTGRHPGRSARRRGGTPPRPPRPPRPERRGPGGWGRGPGRGDGRRGGPDPGRRQVRRGPGAVAVSRLGIGPGERRRPPGRCGRRAGRRARGRGGARRGGTPSAGARWSGCGRRAGRRARGRGGGRRGRCGRRAGRRALGRGGARRGRCGRRAGRRALGRGGGRRGGSAGGRYWAGESASGSPPASRRARRDRGSSGACSLRSRSAGG